MKKYMLALALLSWSFAASAAPAGEQICKGTQYGKNFVFKYGTYALSGDATLKIGQKGKKIQSYELNGGFSTDAAENLTYVAKVGDGTVTWVGGGDENVNAVVVTVKIDKDNQYQLILPCKTTEFHPDSMAN